ncbi:MAG: sensor histidine kinase [Chitinophagaceae bacterium]|nr:sensor histidine kinase [Chitinophagaceae bacterium]
MLPLKPYLCLLLLLLAMAIPSKSQVRTIDSLQSVLDKTTKDSTRCEILYMIASAYEKVDYTIARKIFDSLLILSEKINYTVLQGHVCNEIGGLGFDHGDYPLALKYYNRAAMLYNAAEGADKMYGLASVYNNIGGILSLLNDLETALRYYLKSLAEYEKLKDTTRMVTIYFNIGFVYSDMGEWNKSYEHMHNSARLIHGSINNESNTKSICRLATICFRTGRLNEGVKYLRISDSLINLTKDDLTNIYYHHAYGEYYRHLKNYRKAIQSHLQAYDYANRWHDPYYVADESAELGVDYLAIKNYDSAEIYFNKSLNVAFEYNYRPKILVALGSLSGLERDKGNFTRAYEYKERQASFADSLVKVQNHYRILLMDEEFEAEKRHNEIIQLQKDKQIQALSLKQQYTLNYFLAALVAALLLIVFLGFRNFRHRQKLTRQQGELQQQRIRELEKDRQLLTVDAMLKGQEEERSRLAKDLHDGLGGLLSGVKYSLTNVKDNLVVTPENKAVFDRSLDMLDISITELRRVAHNMMPEMLVKFGLDEALKEYCNANATSRVAVKYQSLGMEQRPDQTTEIIVYRIVQELLTNILKHSGASETFVQLIRDDKRLSIIVEDNGKGFDVASLETSKGAGWTNIRSRVEYLKGQLDIHSQPGKGTLVNIEINM